MKLFEHKKVKNFCSRDESVKILGLEIYKSITNNTYDTKSYFGGLLNTLKKKYEIPALKEINIFKFTIVKTERENWIEKVYLFDIPICTKNYGKKFLQDNKDIILPEDKNIFILCGHHGESYTASALLAKGIMKKYENVKFLCYRECHRKMWNLFWDDIEIGFLKKFKSARADLRFTYKDKNIFKIYPSISQNRIDGFLNSVNLKKDELEKKDIVLTDSDKNSFKTKLKNMNLDLNNFVIIAPEADSYKLCNNEFWQSLCKGLKTKGYDIFLNSMKESPLTEIYEHTFLTHKEIMQLTPLSKGVISLRSGFSELLSYFDLPMHIIYNFENGFSQDEINSKIFYDSLYNYPFINKEMINEYNYLDEPYENLVKKILEKF